MTINKMEIEQPISKFRETPATKIVPVGDIFGLLDVDSSLYKKDKISLLFRKIISRLRQQFDSLSGYTSYSFVNYDSDFSGQPAWDILETLISLGAIDAENLYIKEERYNDAPRFCRIDLFPKYSKGITDGREVYMSIGHGFGKNVEEVCSRAIGEFLERYALLLYHKNKLVRDSVKNLKDKKFPVVDLNLLAGFSSEQKKFSKRLYLNEESPFRWEKVKRLSTGETVYAPAQLVYWNYIHDEMEPFLGEGNTNGAGGWFSKEGAVLSGLYEIIQRDAFLIYWLNKLTPRRINPRTIPHERFQNLLAESERYGFEIYCLDITSDIGAPVFAIIISDSSGKSPRFCLGAGCQADPAKALWRALEEAWSVYYWIRSRPLYPALDKDYRPFREKIGQDERLRLWGNPEMARHLEFFISGNELDFSELHFDFPQKFSSQKEELDFLVKKVEELEPGYEVYYYQPKNPWSIYVGYYSAQVIVPQLVPLYLREFNAVLGAKRLKEVPEKLGFKPADKFNPLPHLFP